MCHKNCVTLNAFFHQDTLQCKVGCGFFCGRYPTGFNDCPRAIAKVRCGAKDKTGLMVITLDLNLATHSKKLLNEKCVKNEMSDNRVI